MQGLLEDAKLVLLLTVELLQNAQVVILTGGHVSMLFFLFFLFGCLGATLASVQQTPKR